MTGSVTAEDYSSESSQAAMYNDFDIMLDHLSYSPQFHAALHTPCDTTQFCLMIRLSHRMLIAACDPMLCPNWGFRANFFASMEDSDEIEACYGWYPAFKTYYTSTHNLSAEVRGVLNPPPTHTHTPPPPVFFFLVWGFARGEGGGGGGEREREGNVRPRARGCPESTSSKHSTPKDAPIPRLTHLCFHL